MSHEAIYLATCNATNVALQVARKSWRVTSHFAFAIVAWKVARKVERPSTFCNIVHKTSCLHVTSPLQLAMQFCQNGPIRAKDVGDLAHPVSCLLLYVLQVAKKVSNMWRPLCNLESFLFVIVALQVARKIALCNMAFNNYVFTYTWIALHTVSKNRLHHQRPPTWLRQELQSCRRFCMSALSSPPENQAKKERLVVKVFD